MFRSILKGITPNVSALPDLKNYNIEPIQKHEIVVKKKAENRGRDITIIEGEAWETTYAKAGEAHLFEFEKVDTKKSIDATEIDEYDTTYLDLYVGSKWRSEQAKTKVVKTEWSAGGSALSIQIKNTANGKTKTGYSERTLADYIKAFYAADAHRTKEGHPTHRKEEG